MCQNYIKYIVSPIPYFDVKEKIFSPEEEVVHETCAKRSEGRLKKYTSCTDTRAWHFDKDQRRRHLVDLMRKDPGKGGYFVPVSLLFELLCCKPGIGNTENYEDNLNPRTTRKAINSLRNILQVVRVPANKGASNRMNDMEHEMQMATLCSNLNMVAARIKSMSDFVGLCDGDNCPIACQISELGDCVNDIQESISRFCEEMSEHTALVLDEVENLYAELKKKGFDLLEMSSVHPSEKSSVCSVNLPLEIAADKVSDVAEANKAAPEEVCNCLDLLENCDGIEDEVRKLKQLADKSEQLQSLLDESVKKYNFLSKESDIIRSERDFLRTMVENMKNEEQEYKTSLSKAEDIIRMYDKVFSQKHKLLVQDCQELKEKNDQLTRLIRNLNVNHNCQVSVSSTSKEICSLWRIPPEKLANVHSVDSLQHKNTCIKEAQNVVPRQVPCRRRKHMSSRPSQTPRKSESRLAQTICANCVPQCSEGDIELILRYEPGEPFLEKNIRMN